VFWVFERQSKGLLFKGFFLFFALTIFSAAAGAQQPAFTQRFQSEGPGPVIGPADVAASRDFAASGQGSTSGAVQAVLTSTTDASTMFIGGVNGGIWVTHNAGASWTPLTDNLSSLSIASLSYNATNAQTLYAGIGVTSNGAVSAAADIDARGGFRNGILVSNDGGATWSTMSNTITGSLIGKSVVSVVGNGTTVLAATAEPQDATQRGAQGYGLYRSVGGGAFALVSGVPAGAATALVGSGTAASPYYVSINTGAGGGVYRSVDNGVIWTAATTIATGQIGRLATAANGAVALATYNSSGALAKLQLSQNGSTWVDLALPPVINGGQGSTNLAIAIDPTNTNVVYIAGDTRTAAPFTATAYRVAFDPSTGQSSFATLTDAGTADNSSAHADSRNFAFDINGRMILVGDGGVYARTSPLSNTGTWTGLNNGLALRESYGVAFDAVSKRLIVAAQDNGVAVQTQPRGQTFTPLAAGDGLNAVVNDHTYASSGESLQYFSAQNLSGLTRNVVDSTGRIVNTLTLLDRATAIAPGWNFVNVDSTHTDFTENGERDTDSGPGPAAKQLPFSSRLILNRNDASRIAIGTNYLYVTTDALISDTSNSAPLTNVGNNTSLGGVTAFAYGTNDNANAILAGANGAAGARLFYSTTSAAGSLQTLGAYAGDAPTGVVFDARSASRFFVADYTSLYGSTNAGTSFTDLTSNLTALNIARPTSVEFIANNGVNALLVGGLPSSTAALSPIAVAMSDGTGTLSGWAAFGRGLPNTIVNLLAYNSTADVLAVGLWGRGIWTLYDVTSYFSTASVLKYGLADNDSAPDASFLTGARPLIKYGAGTLTIAGTSAYTGSTTVNDGTMTVTGSIGSSSNLQIDAAGTVRGTGTLPQTTVNGMLAPGNNAIGTLTVNNGLTFNGGSIYQVMASTTAASSANVTGGAGTATLGGTVQAILQAGNFLPRRSFTILTASGGRTGTFAGSTSNYPFLQTSLDYGANDVTLTVTPGGFARGAQTPNQAAVGGVLDASVATASGDFATVIGAFSLLSTEQAPAAFDAISGQNYAGFATTGVQTAQLFMNNLTQQAGTNAKSIGTAGRIALADACDVACDAPDYHWSAWGGALGGVGTVAGSATASGLNFGIGGFSAGLDRRFDSGFTLGVAGGYTSATATMQSIPGRGSSNTAQI
jgi:autotransporter-associated beta strand protein